MYVSVEDAVEYGAIHVAAVGTVHLAFVQMRK
jgi:hypothetical protein